MRKANLTVLLISKAYVPFGGESVLIWSTLPELSASSEEAVENTLVGHWLYGPRQWRRRRFLFDSLRGEGVLTLDDAQLRGLALAFAEHKHPRPILQKEFSLRLGEYLEPWAPRLFDE
jgi:hypothetical protein